MWEEKKNLTTSVTVANGIKYALVCSNRSNQSYVRAVSYFSVVQHMHATFQMKSSFKNKNT